MKKFAFLLITTISSPLFAKTFTEEQILSLVNDENIQVKELQSRLMRAKSDKLDFVSNFSWKAKAGVEHSQTKEKSLIPFMPIYSPVNQQRLALEKSTTYGLSFELAATNDLRTGSSEAGSHYKELATVVYSAQVNLDLWQDLFGRISRRQNENMKLAHEQAKINYYVGKKNLIFNIRKLYWALVANDQKRKLTSKLLNQAKRQLKDAKKRRANSIADRGEVARYESQLYTRQGQLLNLKREKEIISRQLKQLIPTLATESISPTDYDIDKMQMETLACGAKIRAQTQTPLQYTRYDELSELLKQMQHNQRLVDDAKGGIDLKFSALYKETGVSSDAINSYDYEGSLNDARQDALDNDRSGHQIGLLLTIPFGEGTYDAKATKKKYNQLRLEAQQKKIVSDLDITHRELSESLSFLFEAMLNQKNNSQALDLRVKEMNKKFHQARVSVNNLIQDQDAKMLSDMNVIDIQLAVLHTVFDYLGVFTEMPCSVNK